MTHGITEGQFLEMVSSFLGPFYLLLALMNGLAVLYLWKTGGTSVWFCLANPLGRKRIEVTNLLGWGLVAIAFFILALAAFTGSTGSGAWVPSMPGAWREAIDQASGPVSYSIGTTAALVILFVFRPLFVKPAVA